MIKTQSLERYTVGEEGSHVTVSLRPWDFRAIPTKGQSVSPEVLSWRLYSHPSQPTLLLGQLETDQKTLLVLSHGGCVNPLFTNLSVPQNCGEAWYISSCLSLSGTRNGGQNDWNQDVSQGRNPPFLLYFFPSSPRFNFLCVLGGLNWSKPLEEVGLGFTMHLDMRVHLLGICQPRVHLALAPGCCDFLGTFLLQVRRAFVLKASTFIVMVTAPGFKLCLPYDKDNKGSFLSFWLSKPDLGDREAAS